MRKRRSTTKGSLSALGDVLKKLRERYPQLGLRIQEAQAIDRWPGVVGPAIAKHTRAIRVDQGVLWVEVDHPIWKSELLHRKRQIVDLLNKSCPDESVSDLLLLDPRAQAPRN